MPIPPSTRASRRSGTAPRVRHRRRFSQSPSAARQTAAVTLNTPRCTRRSRMSLSTPKRVTLPRLPTTTRASASANYGDAKYAKALLQFNLSHPLADENAPADGTLKSAQTVYIPPPDILDKRYPDLIGSAGAGRVGRSHESLIREHSHSSLDIRRCASACDCCFLSASRRSCRSARGSCRLRNLGDAAASRSSAAASRGNLQHCGPDRDRADFAGPIPPRWSGDWRDACRSRSRTSSGNVVLAARSQCMMALEATLLTFCPPGPPERIAEQQLVVGNVDGVVDLHRSNYTACFTFSAAAASGSAACPGPRPDRPRECRPPAGPETARPGCPAPCGRWDR